MIRQDHIISDVLESPITLYQAIATLKIRIYMILYKYDVDQMSIYLAYTLKERT